MTPHQSGNHWQALEDYLHAREEGSPWSQEPFSVSNSTDNTARLIDQTGYPPQKNISHL